MLNDPVSETPFVPRALCETMALALRLANSASGAPSRCRKKACRNSDRCHLKIDADGNGHCPGGIGNAVLDQAALMLLFLGRLWESRVGGYIGDFDASEFLSSPAKDVSSRRRAGRKT